MVARLICVALLITTSSVFAAPKQVPKKNPNQLVLSALASSLIGTTVEYFGGGGHSTDTNTHASAATTGAAVNVRGHSAKTPHKRHTHIRKPNYENFVRTRYKS